MTLPEFSTLESVQRRANSERIASWTGDDPAILAQGFQYASGLIFEYLNKRYGETQILSWTITTAPARVLAISDDLCIHWFSSRHDQQNPLIREWYQDAIASLERIRDGMDDLHGAVEDMSDWAVVDETDPVYQDIIYDNCYGGYSNRVTYSGGGCF